MGTGEVLSMGERVITSLTVLITGFVVVFAVLLILIGLVKLYGIIVSSAVASAEKRKAEKEAQAVKTEPEKTVVEATVEAEVNDDVVDDGELIAVIAAAVDAMYGKGAVKVKSIKRVPQSRPVWGTAGIMDNTRPF